MTLIEQKIGYKFQNKKLLNNALTHPSFRNGDEYEYLEFIGDRALGLSISKLLLEAKECDSVKCMANCYNGYVNADFLANIAQNWEITSSLRHKIVHLSNRILANSVEAILGAIYLDSDFDTVFHTIKHNWPIKHGSIEMQSKMQLQELSQAKGFGLPEYILLNKAGDEYAPSFTIQVKACDLTATGTGRNQQIASTIAAKNLLKLLK